MKKVGFFLIPTTKWVGGINYFKNLFDAINEVIDPSLEILIFLPKNISKEMLDMLNLDELNVKIIRTSMLQRYSFYWLVWKLVRKFFNSDIAALPLCIYQGISIISHSDFAKIPGIKIINWIPDFQHNHLPQMFSASEIKARHKEYSRLIYGAHKIIVSSHDAAKDLARFYPNKKGDIFVMPFACRVPDFYWTLAEKDWQSISNKYKIQRHFFYVPNQFYKHKNHFILVDAVRILKNRGINIQIVLSGATFDPRDEGYFPKFQRYISDQNCEDSFQILGFIDSKDIFSLLRFSLAIINPSRFEGWSTTVEECKSSGKIAVVSNLAVHCEQMPEALMFPPDNADLLANHLEEILRCEVDGTGRTSSKIIKINKNRIISFGKNYIGILGL